MLGEKLLTCSQAHCEELENQITELSAHIHAATYRLLGLIREYDDSLGWTGILMRMAGVYLPKSGTVYSDDRYLVRVHTDLETLKADGTGAKLEIDGGRNVSTDGKK